MRIFSKEDLFTERLHLPGGKTEEVVINAIGWEDLAHKSFMAGVQWKADHPGLVPRDSQ